jgi:murein DD-endopeptidase MepM/ murein hydrolase activator NlpD
MAGNHVLMKCRDAWVLLGHMQRGTVRVAKGAAVSSGALVGQVGNSGNTFEPHLHIHAQTPGTDAAPLGGEPLHIRFDGRFPHRNDRIVVK